MPLFSLHPMMSWLIARASNRGDINPISASGLLPLMSIYLGIQYRISGLVILSFDIHLDMSSTVSASKRVLDSSGHSMRCAAVSRLPQFGHLLFGGDFPE